MRERCNASRALVAACVDDRPGEVIVRFTVYGEPAPQGSKTAMLFGKWTWINGQRALVNPRALIVEGRDVKRKDGTRSDGRARHRRWRTTIELEAVRVVDRLGAKIDGPLAIDASFYLTRPPSVPMSILYPAVKPDLDKLVRCLLDGLRPLIAEDSRVVRLFPEKLYADFSRPRAIVTIETLPRTRQELKAAQLLAAHRKDLNATV